MDRKLKTLVLGATNNPGRYAYLAVSRLVRNGHPVIAVGRSGGIVEGISIQPDFPADNDIHTISMYLNARNQEMYVAHILEVLPRRIIFNPGSENPVLEKQARAKGIIVEEACTLVMLATGSY